MAPLAEVMLLDLSGLAPVFAAKCHAIEQALQFRGIRWIWTSAGRTMDQQAALFAKGRDIFGNIVNKAAIVTNARPGQSFHNFGLACDGVALDPAGRPIWRSDAPEWDAYGTEVRGHGCVWGGDWRSIMDRPHAEFHPGLPLIEAQALFRKGGLEAVWASLPTTA